jgi:hypothetical protein
MNPFRNRPKTAYTSLGVLVLMVAWAAIYFRDAINVHPRFDEVRDAESMTLPAGRRDLISWMALPPRVEPVGSAVLEMPVIAPLQATRLSRTAEAFPLAYAVPATIDTEPHHAALEPAVPTSHRFVELKQAAPPALPKSPVTIGSRWGEQFLCFADFCIFGAAPEGRAARSIREVAVVVDSYKTDEHHERLVIGSVYRVFAGFVGYPHSFAALVGYLPLRLSFGPVQVDGGACWSTSPLPYRGTQANWTARAKVRLAKGVSAEWWHFSNARSAIPNPSTDAVGVGFTW